MSIKDLAARISQAWAALDEARSVTNQLQKLQPSVSVPAGEKLSPEQLRNFWRELAENPDSPLLDPQREEIVDRDRRGYGGIAPREDQPIEGRNNNAWQGSHEPRPRSEGGDKLVPRSRIDHALIDPHAYSRLSPAEKRLANSMARVPPSLVGDKYSEEDKARREELRRHRQRLLDEHNSLPEDERQELEADRDRRRDAFWDREGYRDYDPRFSDSSPLPEDTSSSPEDRRPDPPANERPDPPEDKRSKLSGFVEGLVDGLGRRRR